MGEIYLVEENRDGKVVTLASFPLYLILAVDTGYSVPIPMYTITDDMRGIHLEPTKELALESIRNIKLLRKRIKERFEKSPFPKTRVGEAIIQVNNMAELDKFLLATNEKVNGFFHTIRFKEPDIVESVFVPWNEVKSVWLYR